ncbi:unnamed protein product [Angiostrongylus costaricensis]|uniref:Trafficking protein particle complex subunit n=1 Tax=Angiostrongylus costaricensis TaxID=334426 RepID=A0A0R3PBG4_ANGCS|nr:unnamed protein product [Angiostrongylus costaricensis]
MVFSTGAGVAAQVPSIAPSADAARGFVKRIVMEAVFDVLEQQGRAAGLSDPIIQIILDQLTVNIMYQPLECNTVGVNPRPNVNTSRKAMENIIHEYYSDLFDSYLQLQSYEIKEDGYVVPSAPAFEIRYTVSFVKNRTTSARSHRRTGSAVHMFAV